MLFWSRNCVNLNQYDRFSERRHSFHLLSGHRDFKVHNILKLNFQCLAPQFQAAEKFSYLDIIRRFNIKDWFIAGSKIIFVFCKECNFDQVYNM